MYDVPLNSQIKFREGKLGTTLPYSTHCAMFSPMDIEERLFCDLRCSLFDPSDLCKISLGMLTPS